MWRALAAGMLMSLGCATGVAAQAQDRAIVLRTSELYRIGGPSAPDWASFVEIDEMDFGPAGELWIRDSRGRRIVRVAPNGRTGEDLARRGGGPGEFQFPDELAVTGDGDALVGDLVNANVQLLDADGSLITGGRKTNSYLKAVDMAWLDGRDFVAVPQVFLSGGEALIHGPGGMLPANRIPLLKLRVASDVEVREIAQLSYTQPPRTNVSYGQHAFNPGIHWTTHHNRIAIVDGADYDVRVLDANGREVMRVRRPIEARSPSRADRAAAREEARARLIRPDGTPNVAGAADGGAPGQRNAPTVLRRIEQGLDAMTFADRIPVIRDMRYDADGRLWVAREPDVWGRQPLLDVFSPDGEYLGTTTALPRLPDAFGPGGLAAFIEKDELDVPSVRVVRIDW